MCGNENEIFSLETCVISTTIRQNECVCVFIVLTKIPGESLGVAIFTFSFKTSLILTSRKLFIKMFYALNPANSYAERQQQRLKQ